VLMKLDAIQYTPFADHFD